MASLTNPLIGYVSAGTIGLQFQITTGASNASDANFTNTSDLYATVTCTN